MFIAHEHELRVDTLKSVSFARSTAFTKCNGLLLLLLFQLLRTRFCYRFHMNEAKKKSFVWWRFFSTHHRIQNGSSRCLSACISPSVCLYTNICVHVSNANVLVADSKFISFSIRRLMISVLPSVQRVHANRIPPCVCMYIYSVCFGCH